MPRWLTSAALCLLLSGAAVGCHEQTIAPPPAAPVVERPQDAIPADLDVVMRFDVARMRSALGPSWSGEWRRHAPGGLLGVERDDPLLSDALARADTVWLALRPGLRPDLTDNVIVLAGRYADFDPQGYPSQPKWTAPTDLGGGWRVSERPVPAVRSAPVRLYLRHSELLVFVSEAELDSVERAVEQGARDPHVEPPSQGAISVEARGRALARLVRDQAPAAARLLRRASALRGHADISTRGLRAEVELEFEAARVAEQAARALSELIRESSAQHAFFSVLGQAVQVEAVGSVVVARIALDHDTLVAVVACATGSASCTLGSTAAGVQPDRSPSRDRLDPIRD
jgi:hypothetical protein